MDRRHFILAIAAAAWLTAAPAAHAECGERSKVLVHIIREGDDWRIANIIHDSGKSLINHYRAIAAR
jgi:hypothetical protein